MGEPVTEEMLRQWEDDAMPGSRVAARHHVGALVAEVRRLRAAQSTWLGLAEADAAGYARAERDVVAYITSAIDHDAERMKVSAQRGDIAKSNVYAAGHTALSLTRKRIEQGAHRGAAKEGT